MPRSYTQSTPGKGTSRAPPQAKCQPEVYVSSACPTFRESPPLFCAAFCCGSGENWQLPVPWKETPGKKRARALSTGAGRADNNGGKCLSWAGFAQALQLEFATSTPTGTAPLARARVGDKAREWCGGPGSARSLTPRWAHRESAAGKWTPGLPRDCLPWWDPGDSMEVQAACAPGPAPLTHTVSQQHQSRLARPRSDAADRHRMSWASRTAERTQLPLPMEWRMSIEASRSVLSRDWALWNSTTAAAAILPLSHRPRPRPPTPETHSRKAHPQLSLLPIVSPPPLPEHHGNRSLSAGRERWRVTVRAGAPRWWAVNLPNTSLTAWPRVKEEVPNNRSTKIIPSHAQKRSQLWLLSIALDRNTGLGAHWKPFCFLCSFYV